MRNPLLPIVILMASSSSSLGAPVAGAVDGVYRAQDDTYIVIDEATSSVGVSFMSCEHPTVSNGNLHSDSCSFNGHPSGDLNISWRVEGNSIYSEGKRYILAPKLPSLPADKVADAFIPSSNGWMHNGSEMTVDIANGVITYARVKPSLSSTIKSEAVLFKGDLKPSGILLGTAYAFKEGCPPASYPVRAAFSQHNEVLVLMGPGPIRKGCEVVGYSYDSPHSSLTFRYVYGDR